MMIYLIIFASLFIVLLLLVNNTPLFYSEPSAYDRNNEPTLFDSRAEEAFYENSKSSSLIILVHGFPGSPFEWERVGRLLSKDYNVLIPRLYGFGTTREFFRRTYFSQWYKSLIDIYLEYRERYEKVTVCGLSFGGMLTLRLAEDFGDSRELAMERIVVISAPVFINDPLHYLVRSISWFIRDIPSFSSAGDNIDNDGADWVGFYGKFPVQIYSLLMGMRTTRKNLARVRIPALLMHSSGDKTVPFANMDYIYDHISSRVKHKIVYNLEGWKHRKHLLTMFNTTFEDVYRNILRFIKEE